jgi:hypothetical protein
MADVGRFDVLDGESLHSWRAAPRLRRARVCKTVYKPPVFQGNFPFSCVSLYNCDWLDVMSSTRTRIRTRTHGKTANQAYRARRRDAQETRPSCRWRQLYLAITRTLAGLSKRWTFLFSRASARSPHRGNQGTRRKSSRREEQHYFAGEKHYQRGRISIKAVEIERAQHIVTPACHEISDESPPAQAEAAE